MGMNVDASCGICGADAYAARDVAGRIEFKYCRRCQGRAYVVEAQDSATRSVLSPWAPDHVWRARFQAKRTVDVMLAAAKKDRGSHTSKSTRAEVYALVAAMLDVDTCPPWHLWSVHETSAFLESAAPIMDALARQELSPADRIALHMVRSRRSRFPRLSLLVRIRWDRVLAWRDRLLTRFVGRLATDADR